MRFETSNFEGLDPLNTEGNFSNTIDNGLQNFYKDFGSSSMGEFQYDNSTIDDFQFLSTPKFKTSFSIDEAIPKTPVLDFNKLNNFFDSFMTSYSNAGFHFPVSQDSDYTTHSNQSSIFDELTIPVEDFEINTNKVGHTEIKDSSLPKENKNQTLVYVDLHEKNFKAELLQARNRERRNYGRVFKPRPKGSKKIIQFKRTFSYEGYNVPTVFQESLKLQNIAKNVPPIEFSSSFREKFIRPGSSHFEDITVIKRERYIRHGLEKIFHNQYSDVVYKQNSSFNPSKPYEPQYIRYIIDLESNPPLPFNQTRSGLCPYCPEIHFYDIKTSAYAQHLALQHGIYTDNFLTPNPILYGHYKIKKLENTNRKERRKTQAHELERDGVICPCCYEAIGVNCSRKTANSKPLTNYLRHFRDKHFYCKDKSDPYQYFNKLEQLDIIE